jgi:hypothetical protein
MQALSQLSYSPKPKERHSPRRSRPCQGNIPVLSVTYAGLALKKPASRPVSPFPGPSAYGGYWITTLYVIVNDGAVAPVLPFIAPFSVILKLVMAASVHGRVQLGV